MNTPMKKLFLFFIFLLFANPNTSYAKLIEFENCYRTDHVLKENSDEKEDIKNIKWREDFFNQITRLIDILEQVKSPERKPDCKICSDYERNLIVEGSS